MADRVSLSELGRRLGRAKSGLHRAAHRGQITKGDDGLYDVEEARSALAANMEPARQGTAFTPVHGARNGERPAAIPPHIAAQASQDALLATTRVREILRAEGVTVAPDEPLTFNHARTAETIVKVWQRDVLHDEARGRLIKADEAGRRWADEMVKLRARLLAVPGKIAMRLSHLTAHEIQEIDRVVRDAMSAAVGDDDAPA